MSNMPMNQPPVGGLPGQRAAMAGPQDPFASSSSAGGLSPADIIRILKQRRMAIFIVFCVLFAMAVVATFGVRRFYPLYRAEAAIQVKPPQEQAFQISRALIDPRQMELLVEDQVRELRSPSLLRTVMEQPEIQNTSYFRQWKNVAQAIDELQNDLGISAHAKSSFIRVGLSLPNPEEAELIVNTLVSRYAANSRLAGGQEIQDRIAALETTRDRVMENIRSKRSDIRDFRQAAGAAALESERENVAMEAHQIQSEINTLESQLADYQAQYDAIAGRRYNELPITPEMRMQAEANPLVRYWQERTQALEIQRQAMLQSGALGKNHRQIRELDAQIELYREAETARREELFDDIRSQQLEGLQQIIARLNAMLLELSDKQLEVRARQRTYDSQFGQLSEHQADLERLEETLVELDSKLTAAENAREAAGASIGVDTRQAFVANSPSFPNVPLFLMAGFVFSAVGGVGFGFLREFIDQGVRTPLDVTRSAQVSVLGSVPELDEDEADIDAVEETMRRAPQSLLAESFRQVRTNLTFSGPEESQRVLLLTSPGAEDGKTATAINLACTIAQGGQKVLLVDCNFRRPALRNHFENTKSDGLSNVLIGQGAPDDFITATELPNLDLLTSGPLPPTPAELLGSPAMRKFLAEAAERYDRIILDGPPILLVNDASVLVSQVSGVVLVSRAAHNTKGALKRASDMVQRVGGRVIGAVLNGVESRPGGYFRRQYRDFYNYTSDETVPQSLPAAALPDRDDERRA